MKVTIALLLSLFVTISVCIADEVPVSATVTAESRLDAIVGGLRSGKIVRVEIFADSARRGNSRESDA